MPYRFLEDEATADVAFEAWGWTLEEVFRAAADALLNVMVEDIGSVQAQQDRSVALDNDAVDLLLFEFLQQLIYYKDAEQLLLRVTDARIQQEDDSWKLRATGRGERLDPERHAQAVDVKAATLHDFRLTPSDAGWRAHVVLDI